MPRPGRGSALWDEPGYRVNPSAPAPLPAPAIPRGSTRARSALGALCKERRCPVHHPPPAGGSAASVPASTRSPGGSPGTPDTESCPRPSTWDPAPKSRPTLPQHKGRSPQARSQSRCCCFFPVCPWVSHLPSLSRRFSIAKRGIFQHLRI